MKRFKYLAIPYLVWLIFIAVRPHFYEDEWNGFFQC